MDISALRLRTTESGCAEMDLKLTRHHLFSAVLALSTENGGLVDRLRAAHAAGLRHIARNPGVPAHLRASFDEIVRGLDELSTSSSVDDEWARRVAKGIVNLYQQVNQEPP